MPDLSPCIMLWIGERLSAVERACMRSVLAQGHPLTLYTYGDVAGIPDGVAHADASTILPETEILRHASGSVALFSDRFRFELQRRGMGIWLDADVYLLKPLILPDHRNLYGWSEPNIVGAGILSLPENSPIIAPILRLFEAPYIPDWLRPIDRIRAWLRRMSEGGVDVAALPWGVAGPTALTALAKLHQLLDHAQPQPVFYPYDWKQAEWIFDPARPLDEFVRPETVALHLYNYMISDRKNAPAASGSFMARLQAEGA